MIREFIAGAPAQFVTRREFDQHRQDADQRAATIRLQWPVWLLMGMGLLVSLSSLALAALTYITNH